MLQQENGEPSFIPVHPEVPPRDDSYAVAAVYTTDADLKNRVTTISDSKSPASRRSLVESSHGDAQDNMLSPKIGGPGSAFKPYASSENLFDATIFTNKSPEVFNEMKVAQESIRNGIYSNGQTNGKLQKDYRMPIYSKVRELRKPTQPPFSTTDTEPEMRECNMPPMDAKKRGKFKAPSYSTSETEEEYQAYLKSRAKWHGKGGHKDSWDPLLVESPPQITQKPVGIIQKPKAQAAPPPPPVKAQPYAIERGTQIGQTPIYMPPPASASNDHVVMRTEPEVAKEINNAASLLEPPAFERIQKSDSIIEIRGKAAQQQQQQQQQAPPVRPLSPKEEYNTIVPLSVAELNNKARHDVMKMEAAQVQGNEQHFSPSDNNTTSVLPWAKPEGTPNNISAASAMATINGNRAKGTPLATDSANGPVVVKSEQIKSMQEKYLENVQASNTAVTPNGTAASAAAATANPQKELHQKIMNEAIKKVEDKKEVAKKTFPMQRTNPTIAAMEIMTRKELKLNEMEERLAREGGLKMQQGKMEPIYAQIQKKKLPSPMASGYQESQRRVEQSPRKMDSVEKSPVPTMQTRAAPPSQQQQQQQQQPRPMSQQHQYNQQQQQQQQQIRPQSQQLQQHPRQSMQQQQQQPPMNSFQQQQQQLQMRHEIQRQQQQQQQQQQVVQSPKVPPKAVHLQQARDMPLVKPHPSMVKKEPTPVSVLKKASPQPPMMTKPSPERFQQQQQPPPMIVLKKPKILKPEEIQARKNSAERSVKSAMGSLADLDKSSAGKNTAEVARAKSSAALHEEDDIIKMETVRKAAERFEKANNSNNNNSPPVQSSFDSPLAGYRARSKSIGSNLSQKMMELEEDQERVKGSLVQAKSILPWASGEAGPGPVKKAAVIRKRDAAMRRDGGYELRTSKSSDSITAAKMLAEARMRQGQRGLRINQDMSKSIEKQIDVYTKTREDIRKILHMAKTSSVSDRIKIFNTQRPVQPPNEQDLEAKAEAIRKEIEEAKTLQQEQVITDGNVEIQTPIESKVKPLKIPMKPKLVKSSDVSAARERDRGVPGSKLRINQPPGQEHKSEIRSILRKSSSTTRDDSFDDPNDMTTEQKRLSIENLPSVKTKIESYLQVATSELAEDAAQGKITQQQQKPKSILVNKSLHKTASLDRKKAPKLLHNTQALQIYAQSATDYSELEEDDDHQRYPHHQGSRENLLQVPSPDAFQGLRKSKSFAGQFECTLDQAEIDEKQKTMLSFFGPASDASSSGQHHPMGGAVGSVLQNPHVQALRNPPPRRSSITSISDEILGEDDLRDVDAMFESLLNNTFDESSTGGAAAGKVPTRPSLSSSSSSAAAAAAAARRNNTNKLNSGSSSSSSQSSRINNNSNSSVAHRQPRGDELQQQQQQHQQQKFVNQNGLTGRSSSNSSASACANNNNNISGSGSRTDSVMSAMEQRRVGEEAIFSSSSASNLSQQQAGKTAKFLPRQQTWAGHSGGGAGSLLATPPHSPSPTQSEYDTADPWEDY